MCRLSKVRVVVDAFTLNGTLTEKNHRRDRLAALVLDNLFLLLHGPLVSVRDHGEDLVLV